MSDWTDIDMPTDEMILKLRAGSRRDDQYTATRLQKLMDEHEQQQEQCATLLAECSDWADLCEELITGWAEVGGVPNRLMIEFRRLDDPASTRQDLVGSGSVDTSKVTLRAPDPVFNRSGIVETAKERIADPQIVDVDIDDLEPVNTRQGSVEFKNKGSHDEIWELYHKDDSD